MFKYITTQFDQRLSATLYLVGFQFITSICATVLSPLVGRGYDQLGFADTYMILAGLVLALTLISAFLLKDSTPGNEHPSLNLTTR
jgi:OHS family lactose permease-like MFS transporter